MAHERLVGAALVAATVVGCGCGGGDEPGGPTFRDEHPRVYLTDENVARLRALVELLVEKGVLQAGELEDRLRRLVRGDDV